MISELRLYKGAPEHQPYLESWVTLQKELQALFNADKLSLSIN